MAKNPEVKVKITADGGSQTASELKKVEAAAGNTESGLGKLTSKIPALNKALGTDIPDGSKSAGLGMSTLAAGAVAGGAAVAAFAVKGVAAFEDLGVSTGKFADATGLSTEASSRWIEVAGDAGISTEALSDAIGRMEKSLGANRRAFDDYGVSVVAAADGTVDANATFLNAVDALNKIEDPAKRAEAGAKIFGKSWQGMAELIGRGAPQLRQDLEAVQPEKIFTAKDVAAARKVRDGFDAIKDAGEGLLLTVGKALAPVIADLAPKFGKIVEAVGPLVTEIGTDLAGAFEAVSPVITGATRVLNAFVDSVKLYKKVAAGGVDIVFKISSPGASEDIKRQIQEEDDARVHLTGTFNKLAGANHEYTEGMYDALSAQEHLTASQHLLSGESQSLANALIHADDVTADFKVSTEEQKRATDAAKRASDNYSRAIEAQRQATQDVIDTERAAIDDKYAARKATRDAADAVAEYTKTLGDHKSSLADIASATDTAFDAVIGMSEAQVKAKGATLDSKAGIDTQIQSLEAQAATLAPGNPLRARLEEYIQDLKNIPTSIDTSLNLHVRGGSADIPLISRRPGAKGATGGVVTHQVDNVTLGEAGPEAVIPLNKLPGAHPLPDDLFTAASVPPQQSTVINNFTIEFHSFSKPTAREVQVLANELERHARRNGRS